jgi:hypothetical protein
MDICNLPIITTFLNDLWRHPVWSANELKDINMKIQFMEISLGATAKWTMEFCLGNDTSY